MLIEFYGLPGAGKTTISRKLAEGGEFEIIKIRNKKDLFWYNFLFFVKHPIKFFATLFYLIINSGEWRIFYYKLTNLFLHHNAKYQKALRIENAILDQGYFQNILSIFEKPVNADFLVKYSKFLLKPDKLIILNLPPDDILKRVGGRGYVARERFGQEYFNKWLEVVKTNNKTFLENLDKIGVDYVIIDASNDVEGVCKEVRKNVYEERS